MRKEGSSFFAPDGIRLRPCVMSLFRFRQSMAPDSVPVFLCLLYEYSGGELKRLEAVYGKMENLKQVIENEQAKPDRLVKRGLVLEGGGAKGAFAFGCLQAIREAKIPIHAVSGTSVGALNAALWATESFDFGREQWENMSQDKLYPWRKPKWFHRLVMVPIILGHLAKALRSGHVHPVGVFRVAFFCYNILFMLIPLTFLCVNDMRFLHVWEFAYVVITALMCAAFVKPDARNIRHWFLTQYSTILVFNVLDWKEKGSPNIALLISVVIIFLLDRFFRSLSSRTFWESTPLRKTIETIVKMEFKIPTYVTFASAQNLIDPDGLQWDVTWKGNFRTASQLTWYPEYLKIQDQNLSDDDRVSALLASAALPFGIVPSVKLGEHELVDGGIADNRPVFPLVEIEKCDEVFVVLLRPIEKDAELSLKKNFLRIKWLQQVKHHNQLSLEHEFLDPSPIPEGSKVIPEPDLDKWPTIHFFAPCVPLGGPTELIDFFYGTVNFDPEYAKVLMKFGKQTSIQKLQELGYCLNTGQNQRSPESKGSGAVLGDERE